MLFLSLSLCAVILKRYIRPVLLPLLSSLLANLLSLPLLHFPAPPLYPDILKRLLRVNPLL